MVGAAPRRYGSFASRLSRMPSALSMAATAVSQGQGGAKQIMPAQLALGSRPLFPPGEIASLAAVPDTAIVLATRGRVARRDLVVLRPEYPAVKAQSAKPKLSASSSAVAPREIVPMAAASA